jgi:hypothetical protein
MDNFVQKFDGLNIFLGSVTFPCLMFLADWFVLIKHLRRFTDTVGTDGGGAGTPLEIFLY